MEKAIYDSNISHGEEQKEIVCDSRPTECLPGPSEKRGKTINRLSSLETKITQLEVKTTNNKDRLEKMDQRIEELKSRDVKELKEEMRGATLAFDSLRKEIVDVKTMLLAELTRAKDDVAVIRSDCKKSVLQGVAKPKIKLHIPKPQTFKGTRNAEEVDNFLFTLEQYFHIAGVEEDADKLSQAPLYFTDSAITWWRMKYAQIDRGTLEINTWAEFKALFKNHFYPRNIEFEAREKTPQGRYSKVCEEIHKLSIRDFQHT